MADRDDKASRCDPQGDPTHKRLAFALLCFALLQHVLELLRRVVPNPHMRRIVEFERIGHIDALCHRAVCFSGKDKLLRRTKNDYNFKNRKNTSV